MPVVCDNNNKLRRIVTQLSMCQTQTHYYGWDRLVEIMIKITFQTSRIKVDSEKYNEMKSKSQLNYRAIKWIYKDNILNQPIEFLKSCAAWKQR